MTELLDAALGYVAVGLHVLPVQPRGKPPLTADGLKSATVDPDQIRAWWRRWPSANVAIACQPSGLVVVDIDGPTGLVAFRDLQRRYGHAGNPAAAVTGRAEGSGWHAYYSQPGDGPSVCTQQVADGLEVRAASRGAGAGAYVIAPPSIHPSGRTYEWATDHHSPAPLPGWLLELLTPRPTPAPRRRPRSPGADSRDRQVRYAVAALQGRAEDLAAVHHGRHAALLAAARYLGSFVADGLLNASDVTAALDSAVRATGYDAKVGQADIRRTIAAGLAYAQEAPAA